MTTPLAPSPSASTTRDSPATLGTAGHIDHGKTALVAALTGVDTDRLPEEHARGMSIELGYAPLALPSGRRLSVIDVPGHERFVRTMVSGATGIDLFLMVIAADDGVMPQTREHAAVLKALEVTRGVVAITKADRSDPARGAAEAAELLPGVEIVACSARTGAGIADVLVALERVSAELPDRDTAPGRAVLHVDRVFTIRGAGTVVTGTLRSGSVGRGDTLVLLPRAREVRVRSVQVHDMTVDRAKGGQRVALNLSGVALHTVRRGDAIVSRDAGIQPTLIIDAALKLDERAHNAQRVQIHHGTRSVAGRLVLLEPPYWQIRLEQPLLAVGGDRIVVRSVAPPDTLGGGTVIDPGARRHGRRRELIERLQRIERGDLDTGKEVAPALAHEKTAPSPPVLGAAAIALADRLLAAGHEPLSTAELGDAAAELPALRTAGIAVRVGRDLHAHADALAVVQRRVAAIIDAEGKITLARLRDELGTSRKYAQALIEHLDAARITKRLADDARILRNPGRHQAH